MTVDIIILVRAYFFRFERFPWAVQSSDKTNLVRRFHFVKFFPTVFDISNSTFNEIPADMYVQKNTRCSLNPING